MCHLLASDELVSLLECVSIFVVSDAKSGL